MKKMIMVSIIADINPQYQLIMDRYPIIAGEIIKREIPYGTPDQNRRMGINAKNTSAVPISFCSNVKIVGIRTNTVAIKA